MTVAGSSTVGPIAQSEIASFPAYWNNLVSANSAWGTTAALDINQVNLATLGSGTAIPAVAGIAGTADVGEMSRPPSTGEYGTGTATCSYMQSALTVSQSLLVQT